MRVRDWRTLFIDLQLDNMEGYLDFFEKAIKSKIKEFEENLEKKAINLSVDDKERFFEFHSDEYWKLADVIPYMTYTNFIISLYSYIEHELFNLCKDIRKEQDIKLSYEDVGGKGIYRAKLYLSKVADIEIEDKHWNELVIIGKLRNKIVHNGGKFYIDSSKKDLKQLYLYLKKNSLTKRFGEKTYFEFCPNLSYCEYLIGLGRELFTDLYNKKAGKEN